LGDVAPVEIALPPAQATAVQPVANSIAARTEMIPLSRRGQTIAQPPAMAGLPLNTAAAPAVVIPLGAKDWSRPPTDPAKRSFGSHSHEGPPSVASEKGNEDFAFHLELPGPEGSTWAIVGVADGVSGGTWSKRAARHAASAFIETVTDFFRDPVFPRSEEQISAAEWRPVCARLFHGHIQRRLEEDRRMLLEGRYLDPAWSPEHYEKRFLDGPDAFGRTTEEWFQTTLLAAALGPWGGFAMFLGDGFARVDRWGPGSKVDRTPVPLEDDGGAPETPIRFHLTEADVAKFGVKGIPSRGATQFGILLTTDGVSKSPVAGLRLAAERAGLQAIKSATALDDLVVESNEQCVSFLENLANLPENMVEGDNMSVAFARVQVGG
jgi:hypothetical protein